MIWNALNLEDSRKFISKVNFVVGQTKPKVPKMMLQNFSKNFTREILALSYPSSLCIYNYGIYHIDSDLQELQILALHALLCRRSYLANFKH